ncbi:MAG TPA: thiamine pyrophosphate-binding protein [Pseudorhodoferax sp.]|nr:thiamine pyrophosphate-binding protein [Pseudorhodoferax sp.]
MTDPSLRPDGGELIARTLHAAGVRRIFALHGGHLEAFYRGCRQHQLELIDFRHEAAAGHAADGHARATGELGVCVVTAGPGFTNVITAAVNANLDGVPTLFIVGAPPLREAEFNPLQGGIDQVAMLAPGVKWAHRVTHTERLPDLVAMAIRTATTGRRGAVLLEVPIDVMHIAVDAARVMPPAGLATRPRPAPSAAETEQAIALLAGAERPVIVCGGEARFAGCEAALRRFAEQSGIPVFTNARAFGMLPWDHALHAGESANLRLLQAEGQGGPDVVLLLGAKLGMFMGGRQTSLLPQAGRLIQVLAQPEEIGRIRDIALPIAADCGSTLESLLAASRERRWPARQEWAARCTGIQHQLAARRRNAVATGGIHPYHAALAVAETAGPDAAYVLDGGEAAMWAGHAVRVNGPGQYASNGYLGLLGGGMGLAIGAQLARPDRRVVQIAGDGAIGFHLQEFDTMVRRRLPIVTVVLNNRIWGMSLHGQELLYGPGYEAISRLGEETSYARIAEGFGCHAETVTRTEDVAPAMRRALDSGRPACLDVRTDPAVTHPGMQLMLQRGAPGDIVIPYYESIPAPQG